jgi:hypothetical protein
MAGFAESEFNKVWHKYSKKFINEGLYKKYFGNTEEVTLEKFIEAVAKDHDENLGMVTIKNMTYNSTLLNSEKVQTEDLVKQFDY